MRTTFLSFAALLPAALLLAGTVLALPVQAAREQDLETQKQQAQQEYETAQETLEDLQGQTHQAQQQVETLQGEAGAIAAQLEGVYAALQEAQRIQLEQQANYEQADAALQQTQAEYEASRTRCKEQLSAMQKLDGGGAIGLLAQADSLYQLLTFTDALRQISAKNNEILQELAARSAALEQARQEAETARLQAEAAAAALEQQQAALDGTRRELQEALQDANDDLSEQQAAEQAQAAVTEAARKAYEEATAALDAYVRAQSDRYTTDALILTSLEFRCPLDSYGSITTRFSEPDPWGVPHRGTDFAAPNGTPIYAVAAGVISAAGPVNSYGNCVQVSHGTASDGSRYDSLYAHMSRIAVTQGQQVQKGDILGYVGNTGDVFGANGGYHLHLELRINGVRTDPLAYIPH